MNSDLTLLSIVITLFVASVFKHTLFEASKFQIEESAVWTLTMMTIAFNSESTILMAIQVFCAFIHALIIFNIVYPFFTQRNELLKSHEVNYIDTLKKEWRVNNLYAERFEAQNFESTEDGHLELTDINPPDEYALCEPQGDMASILMDKMGVGKWKFRTRKRLEHISLTVWIYRWITSTTT